MADIGGIKVKLNADVDSSGLVKGYAQVEQASQRIQKEFKDTEAAAKTANANIASSTNTAASAAKKAAGAFKMQKGSLQQLGYQIQDVAVMSQYGADKFIILGTQGSQIASLFGPGGAVFGAVLAVAAVIGGTLVKSIDNAKNAADGLPAALMTRLDEIKARFEEVDEASRGAFLRVEFDKINAEYNKLQEQIDRTTQLIEDMGPQAGVAYAKQAERVDELKAKQKDLANLMERMSQMSMDAIDFGGIDLSVDGGDTGIQGRIESIRAGLDREKELYETWRQTRAGITAGIITDEQAQLIQADVAAQQRINAKFDNTVKRLEEERALLLENQTLTAEEKAARQLEIDAAERDADILHQEQLKQQRIKYAQDTADAIKSIERKKNNIIISQQKATWSAASGFLDQFAGQSKAAAVASIALNKGVALAQAMQNTAVGIMKAYSVDPYGVLASRVALMGKIQMGLIAATGLSQAAGAVRGTNSSNTFSGGVPAVNTTTSNAQQQPQTTLVDLRVTGNGGILDVINFEIENGGKIINAGG